MKDMDYISQMVQETLQSNKFQGVEASEEPVEIRVKRNVAKNCLVISNEKGQDLEIPENWGPFKNRIVHNFIVDSSDDPYDFLSVLSSFLGQELGSIRIIIEKKLDDSSFGSAA